MLKYIQYIRFSLLTSAIFFCLASTGWATNNEIDQSISAAQPDTLRIGYFELIPHIEKGSDNRLEGPALEYIKLVLQEMKIDNYVMKSFPVQRAFITLLSGEIDMVLFAAKTPNTITPELILTDTDVTFIQPGLVVKSQDPLTQPLEQKNFLNKRLAYWSGGYIPDFLRNNSIELISVAGNDVYKRGFKLVKHNRVDGFFHVDSMALEWWLTNTDATIGLKLLTLPHTLSVKSVFSKKSAERYKAPYEKALNKVKTIKPYRTFFFEYKKGPEN